MVLNRAHLITIKMPVLQTPESFKGGTFKAGFCSTCVPLVFYSIVTVAITTFDISTDWLAYASIRDLGLDTRLKNKPDNVNSNLDNLYIALPHIFLAFCILASIIYAMDVIHFFYKFGTFRKKFFDQRDGVKNEDTVVEKFGGEGCVLLLVIFEDLPLSLLILALQGLVSCHCILLLNTAVLYLCIVATIMSLVWKLVQVLWSSGCCGKRYEYHSNRIIGVVRIVSAIFLFGALGVNVLNCILAKPKAFVHLMPHNQDHSLFDKVFIERWITQDQVVFMETLQHPHRSHHNDPIKMQYANIVSLNDILQHSYHNSTLTLTKKCSEHGHNMNFTKFMTSNDTSDMQESSECEAMFHFFYDTSSETIIYDYGYRILGLASGTTCMSGPFQQKVMIQATMDSSSQETTTELMVSSVSMLNDNDNTPANTSDIPDTPSGMEPMELAHHVTLLSSMATGHHDVPTFTKACKNTHMAQRSMRSFNPCLFVKSEM